jgi:hypothetical protein
MSGYKGVVIQISMEGPENDGKKFYEAVSLEEHNKREVKNMARMLYLRLLKRYREKEDELKVLK